MTNIGTASGKKSQVVLQLRHLIIQDWMGDENGGQSLGKIAKKFNLAKSTVHIVKKCKTTRSVDNIKGRGRKSILTQREKRQILKEVKSSPFVSTPELSTKIHESFWVGGSFIKC